MRIFERYPELKNVVVNLKTGTVFKGVLWRKRGDYYLVLDEFDAYVECQAKIAQVFEDQARWARMCIMNIANSGKFSTDRTIAEYARDIWNIHPCPINGD